jgi:hypothetical protein
VEVWEDSIPGRRDAGDRRNRPVMGTLACPVFFLVHCRGEKERYERMEEDRRQRTGQFSLRGGMAGNFSAFGRTQRTGIRGRPNFRFTLRKSGAFQESMPDWKPFGSDFSFQGVNLVAESKPNTP